MRNIPATAINPRLLGGKIVIDFDELPQATKELEAAYPECDVRIFSHAVNIPNVTRMTLYFALAMHPANVSA